MRRLSSGRRHSVAAICGVLGLVVGSVAAMGGSATAAEGDLTTTIALDCVTVVGTKSNPFVWNAQVTLSAVRPAASTNVTVTAKVSDMPGIAPVQMLGFTGTDQVVLDLAGVSKTLTGSGKITNAGANEPVPMPPMQGSLDSSAATLAASLTSLQLIVSGISTDCTPSGAPSLGTVTIVEGTPPTPTPTPTTTTSATATPTPKASATAKTGKSGQAAKGKVAFACTLSIGSKFDYDATISVSGYREKAGDDVSLVATMSDLPGIAPVVIDGPMDFTLDLKVGGEKVTLKSTGDVNVQPKQVVPVTDLSGTVAADGDELAVSASAFTFNFASAGIGADCTAASGSLGKMTVGTDPIETDSGNSSSTPAATGGSTLPKTGGGDSMPVVALWALALTLLGVAGLLCVPRTRRQH